MEFADAHGTGYLLQRKGRGEMLSQIGHGLFDAFVVRLFGTVGGTIPAKGLYQLQCGGADGKHAAIILGGKLFIGQRHSVKQPVDLRICDQLLKVQRPDGHAVGKEKAVVDNEAAVYQTAVRADIVESVGIDDDQRIRIQRQLPGTADRIAAPIHGLQKLDVFMPVRVFVAVGHLKAAVENKGQQRVGHIVGLVTGGVHGTSLQ